VCRGSPAESGKTKWPGRDWRPLVNVALPLSPAVGHAVAAAQAGDVDQLVNLAAELFALARLDEAVEALVERVQPLNAAANDFSDRAQI
jgi:hypothetical protein